MMRNKIQLKQGHVTPHAQKEYVCFEQEVVFHRRLIFLLQDNK